MIKMNYHRTQEKQASEFADELKSMSVAFELKLNDDISELQIVDGDSVIVGDNNVREYLEQLRKELHSWHYCDC